MAKEVTALQAGGTLGRGFGCPGQDKKSELELWRSEEGLVFHGGSVYPKVKKAEQSPWLIGGFNLRPF